jgi:hypothetical protein
MFFYVRSDLNSDAQGKENVPVNRAQSGDENDENSSQQLHGTPRSGLRAFL